MKCDILFFSDEMGSVDDQLLFHKACTYNGFEPTSVAYTTDFPSQDEISGKDLIFIDYGGIPKCDIYYSLVNRLEKLIEYNHDKQFVFALTMPK